MDWKRQLEDERETFGFRIWCVLYKRFDGIHIIDIYNIGLSSKVAWILSVYIHRFTDISGNNP